MASVRIIIIELTGPSLPVTVSHSSRGQNPIEIP